METKTIGVTGLGLMGASLCKALGERGHRILGKDTDEHVQKYALLTGTVQGELTDENAGDCDYLFLAVYPGAAVETLRQLAPLIRKDAVVCDLCGVKRAVCEPCFETAKEYGFTFVGGHPMAGKQFSGIKYADGNLFRGATMILVPREKEDLFMVSRLSELLRETGFRSVTVTTAEKHDEMIAFTSQLAHVVSNAYIKSPTATEHLAFSAGSYRDLTRVAKLNETMWTELFLDNAEHLGFELDCLIRSLQEYRDAIAAGDAQELKRLLREGRERKEAIDTEWKEK
uniref:Prephenate dehydrogenase n=1 Tax=uncultured bacterium Contig27 TaxID=1393547 RepID=W0FII3_9BACT|nr:prephenate dehydrogenase [uncultured bacterium Contig27]